MADTPTQPVLPQQPAAPPPAPGPRVVADKVKLTVRNRIRIIFDEDVKAVTSRNETGIFDVLPEHSNFISVINKSIIAHKLDGTEITINLNNGVMKVKENTVHCYIDLLTAESAKK